MKNAGFEKLTIVFVVGLVFWSSSAARAGELTDAVKADDPQRIQALISGGADVNELDRFGTPLHMAVARGSVEIARVLIDAGADLEAEGSLGARPLHTAALGNQAAVAALLIERGAEVDTRDSKGMTPLIVAASYGHVEIAERFSTPVQIRG
jgi:ankyrin repeat protein